MTGKYQEYFSEIVIVNYDKSCRQLYNYYVSCSG